MKIIKKILIPISLLISIFIAGIIIYTKNLNTKQPQVCINNTCFSIEIAETPQERQIWLMHREHLPEKSGMLFVFQQQSPYGFWMKNTLIPLDMIWIDQDQKIIDIQQAVPCTTDPCPSYKPSWPALYVLELNSWISEKYGIKVWDNIEIIK